MFAHAWTAGSVVAPFVVAAGLTLVGSPGPQPAEPGTGRTARAAEDAVEMEVLGVVPLESDGASLLVLRQKGGAVLLPMFVGTAEGTAIDRRLKRMPTTHPGAADLLFAAIGALGGKVTRVEIQGVHAAMFRAQVSLLQGGKRLDVEGRPSDSVALAMSAHAPIFATQQVIADAGLTPEELRRFRPHAPHGGDDPDARPTESF
jgi:bifunctional DNase/RNase